MSRHKLSRGASRKVYRAGHDRIHKKNFTLVGLMRGSIRL